MDWGHLALGTVAIVLGAVVIVRRRRSHSFHVRIDWEAAETFRDEDPDDRAG